MEGLLAEQPLTKVQTYRFSPNLLYFLEDRHQTLNGPAEILNMFFVACNGPFYTLQRTPDICRLFTFIKL